MENIKENGMKEKEFKKLFKVESVYGLFEFVKYLHDESEILNPK